MLTYKRIFVSIGIVLLFAIVFQLLRINTLTEWSKAENVFNELKASEFISTDIPPSGSSEDRYIVLHNDSNDTISERIFQNVIDFFKYTKMNYDVLDKVDGESLSNADIVVITTRRIDSIGDISLLVKFMEEGGTLLLSVSPEQDSSFRYVEQKLGIYESGTLYYAEGIHLAPGMLIGGALDIKGNWILNSSLSVRLTDKCKIYADADDGNPLLWSVGVGRGKALVINGTFLEKKSGIGIFSAMLAQAREVFIYPVINAKVVFLDYFPFPISVNEQYMKKHYGRSCEGFIRDIWWPDMAATSRRYDIKYTSAFTTGSNVSIEPNLSMRFSNSMNFSFFGREILHNGGEIALMGIDDQPIVFNGTSTSEGKPLWSDREKAEKGLNIAMSALKERFQNYTLRCYIIPNGIISDEGLGLVRSIIDQLGVIRGLYEGDPGRQFIQNFEQDSKGVVHYPSVSSGFKSENTQEWKMSNVATALGVVSHVLDAREIMFAETDEFDWKILGREFFDLFGNIFDKYGWMRSLTVSQAAEEVKRYIKVKPHIHTENDSVNVYCEDFAEPLSFILRSSYAVKSKKGCTIRKIEEGFYLVTASEPAFSVKLEGR